MLKVNDYLRKQYEKKIPSHDDVLSLVFKVKKESTPAVISEDVEVYDEGKILDFLGKATAKIKNGLADISKNYTQEMQRLDAATTTRQLIATSLFDSSYTDPNTKRIVDDLFKKYPKETAAAVAKIQELKTNPGILKDKAAAANLLKSALAPIDNIITSNDPNKLAKLLAQGTPDEAEEANDGETDQPAEDQPQQNVPAKASVEAVKNDPHIQSILKKIESLIEANKSSDVIGVISGKSMQKNMMTILQAYDKSLNVDDPKKPNFTSAKDFNLIIVKNVKNKQAQQKPEVTKKGKQKQ